MVKDGKSSLVGPAIHPTRIIAGVVIYWVSSPEALCLSAVSGLPYLKPLTLVTDDLAQPWFFPSVQVVPSCNSDVCMPEGQAL